jgi:hypothetical protein
MRTVQIKTMILDTINKEIRSKMLMFIFIISTVIILLANSLIKLFYSSVVMDPTNVGSSGPMLLSLMFSFVNFWSVLISIVFGVSAIRSDFSNNIIYQYLAMPIKRSDYFFSRLIGTWIIVYTFYLYAYLASLVLFSMATHSWVAHSGHLLSAVMMGIFIFLCILFSTLFSFFGNKMGALLLAGMSWLVLTVSDSAIRELTVSEYFSNLSLMRVMGLFVYWFLPRLGNISELATSFLFQKEFKMNLWVEMPHLLITTAFLLWLGQYFIKRKDF